MYFTKIGNNREYKKFNTKQLSDLQLRRRTGRLVGGGLLILRIFQTFPRLCQWQTQQQQQKWPPSHHLWFLKSVWCPYCPAPWVSSHANDSWKFVVCHERQPILQRLDYNPTDDQHFVRHWPSNSKHALSYGSKLWSTNLTNSTQPCLAANRKQTSSNHQADLERLRKLKASVAASRLKRRLKSKAEPSRFWSRRLCGLQLRLWTWWSWPETAKPTQADRSYKIS